MLVTHSTCCEGGGVAEDNKLMTMTTLYTVESSLLIYLYGPLALPKSIAPISFHPWPL